MFNSGYSIWQKHLPIRGIPGGERARRLNTKRDYRFLAGAALIKRLGFRCGLVIAPVGFPQVQWSAMVQLLTILLCLLATLIVRACVPARGGLPFCAAFAALGGPFYSRDLFEKTRPVFVYVYRRE